MLQLFYIVQACVCQVYIKRTRVFLVNIWGILFTILPTASATKCT